ncbi:MAG TPA: TolC family protein [Chthoniobacterales bacterium]|nr:TolC family protein [Chthoniobacterales bacterium]
MASAFGARFGAAGPAYSVDEAVALAKKQNPEILMAAKQVEAARGGVVEARAGFLPGVVSNGILRKRERAEPSRLRSDDYDASVQIVQNLYTGGAITSQLAIARLIEEKRTLEYQALVNRVSMDVRLVFYDVLLNRAQIRVREQSVRVFEEELKTQRERFETGTVGSLNVSRAEVALANEQPELIDAQTRLQNSELRLAQLIGVDASGKPVSRVQAAGQLQYAPKHPDLTECLAYADVTRPEIRARQIDVEIETQQLALDRSATRPRVEAFAGYEVYSERDPEVGPEFNHGFVVGLNATWHIFDGYATRGRLQATNARRDAALHALEAAKLSVASDVRSAFLDLQQAERVLQSETRNVQNADESLEIAKGNLAAGLGTQLDILQAASDVTRTRTTRVGAIYLHNVAMARLARACAREPDSLGFAPKVTKKTPGTKAVADIAAPPTTLGGAR